MSFGGVGWGAFFAGRRRKEKTGSNQRKTHPHSPRAPACHARQPTRLPCLWHKLSDQLALAIRALDKLHVCRKRALVEHAAALRAGGKARRLVDFRLSFGAARRAEEEHHGCCCLVRVLLGCVCV